MLLVASGFPHMRSRKRQVAGWGLAVTAAAIVLVTVGSGLAVALASTQVRSGGSAARAALDQARDGDAPSAQAHLTGAAHDFHQASSRVNGPLTTGARLVPGLSQHLVAVRTTIDQGERISASADDLLATADYDKLQYDGHLDLPQVQALAAPAARMDATLAHAQRSLSDVDSDALLPPLRDQITKFNTDITGARRDADLASSLLAVTPDLFGADGPRRYLVVFQQPAELRGSGGFVGNYAELLMDQGKVTMPRSGRIVDLIDGPNKGNRTLRGPADYVRRYGRFHPEEFVQDVTFSPDFPSDAQVLKDLYPQAGGSEVDGVIAVDPTGLAALLKLTGPINVPGLVEPLTADNAVEVLTRSQYVQLPDESERGDILTEATRLTFEKLTASRLPAPARSPRP